MTVNLTIPVFLLGAIIAQGIFAFFLLVASRKNILANRLLSLLVLSFSLWLIDGFYQQAGIYQQDPDFYFQPIFYSLSLGPLLYLYVRSLTQPTMSFHKRDLLHFIPVFCQAGLYFFLFFQDYSFRRWFWFEVHGPITYSLEFYLTLALLSGYGLAAVWRIRQFQHWLREHYSAFSQIRLQWLQVVVGLMLLLCALWGVDFIVRDADRVFHWQSVNALAMGVVVLILSAGGLRQQAMGALDFTPATVAETSPDFTPDQDILQRIEQRMQDFQDFRQSELTLKAFAGQLRLPVRQVSRHLNHGFQQSFVDFVNRQRVDYLVGRLEAGDLEQFTLLAIALDSGFNSKSSFNRAFKRFRGVTPSAFLKAKGLTAKKE